VINATRAGELFRDFTRSRQNAVLGWPDESLYSTEDIAYFKMLEADRMRGRVQIEGTILNLSDLPESS